MNRKLIKLFLAVVILGIGISYSAGVQTTHAATLVQLPSTGDSNIGTSGGTWTHTGSPSNGVYDGVGDSSSIDINIDNATQFRWHIDFMHSSSNGSTKRLAQIRGSDSDSGAPFVWLSKNDNYGIYISSVVFNSGGYNPNFFFGGELDTRIVLDFVFDNGFVSVFLDGVLYETRDFSNITTTMNIRELNIGNLYAQPTYFSPITIYDTYITDVVNLVPPTPANPYVDESYTFPLDATNYQQALAIHCPVAGVLQRGQSTDGINFSMEWNTDCDISDGTVEDTNIVFDIIDLENGANYVQYVIQTSETEYSDESEIYQINVGDLLYSPTFFNTDDTGHSNLTTTINWSCHEGDLYTITNNITTHHGYYSSSNSNISPYCASNVELYVPFTNIQAYTIRPDGTTTAYSDVLTIESNNPSVAVYSPVLSNTDDDFSSSRYKTISVETKTSGNLICRQSTGSLYEGEYTDYGYMAVGQDQNITFDFLNDDPDAIITSITLSCYTLADNGQHSPLAYNTYNYQQGIQSSASKCKPTPPTNISNPLMYIWDGLYTVFFNIKVIGDGLIGFCLAEIMYENIQQPVNNDAFLFSFTPPHTETEVQLNVGINDIVEYYHDGIESELGVDEYNQFKNFALSIYVLILLVSLYSRLITLL